MSNVSIPSTARKAIVTLQRWRNGLYPEAGPVTRIQEEANRLVALRSKQWSFASPIQTFAKATQRWRCFIHTSSHCRYIDARILALPSGSSGQPLCTVSFTIPGAGSPAASITFSPGVEGGTDCLDVVSIGQSKTVNLLPDQDYEVNVTDTDDAATIALCMFEVALQHTTDNGYIPSGVVAQQDILDAHRSGPTGILRTAWKRNGAPLITWSSDSGARTLTSATTTNLIDGVTGAPTAATAGFTLDLAHRSTLRRAANGIPCIMRVYGKFAGAPSAEHVYLTNSAGTIVADCEIDNASEQWFSTGGFDLPATNGKYDLQFKSDGANLLTVRAVSIYQLE